MDYTDFAKQGLGWAVSVVLACVVVYLFKLVQTLYKKIDDLQETRFEGTQATIEKYNSAMGDFSQTSKLLLAKLDGEKKA